MDEILAHGSKVVFDEFDLAFCRRTSMGRGVYFTNDFDMAQVYSSGSDPIVARICIENPYEIDADVVTTSDVMEWARIFKQPDAREQLIASGYDGVVFREGGFIEAVAFHTEQIETMGRHPSFAAAEACRQLTALRP
jgi:hypothetical protein